METDVLSEGNGSPEKPMDLGEEPMEYEGNDTQQDALESKDKNKQEECMSPMETGGSPGEIIDNRESPSDDGEIDTENSLQKDDNSAKEKATSSPNSNEDMLDLNSPINSPIVLKDGKTELESNVTSNTNSKSLDNGSLTLENNVPAEGISVSGKSEDFAQVVTNQENNDSSGELLSDESVKSDDDDGSLNETDLSKGSDKIQEKTNITPKSMLSVHDRLDFSLRSAPDDHGELDYEEEVDYGLDTSKKDEELAKNSKPEKEEGEDSEKEEGEHISDEDSDGELQDDDDCEEGEIKEREEGEEISSDEETFDDQPICRFFVRGSCTWGNNCRFFHPGGNNGNFDDGPKEWPGNAPPGGDTEVMPPPIVESPPAETAWERGLRQAKELRKKSQKRKEMETDFEEKRKNLSLNASDLLEEKPIVEDQDNNKENEQEKIHFDPYYDNIASPPTPFEEDEFAYNVKPVTGWHGDGHYENFEVRWHQDPPKRFNEPYPDFRIPENERGIRGVREPKFTAKYRQNQGPPPDRMDKRKEENRNIPKRYDKYENFSPSPDKPRRPTEPVEANRSRGEQWIDPWARAKSPVRRKNSSSRSISRGRRRSRSDSGSSSYSSRSYSSRSRSSSFSSRSSYSRSSSYSSRSSSHSRSPPPRRKGLPTGEPPRRLPVGEPPKRLPAGEPPKRLPAGEPQRRLPAGEPQRRLPAGEPQRRLPAGEPQRRLPAGEPQRRTRMPPKASDIPSRSLVAKAGPMVPNLAKGSLGNIRDQRGPPSRKPPSRAPPNKVPEGPPKPPQKSVEKASPKVIPAKSAPVKPPVPKPSVPEQASLVKPVNPSLPLGAKKPQPAEPGLLSADSRPGRSLHSRNRSRSSGSSSSRSRSSSASSKLSRSRSHSSTGSSSSSTGSSDSDDLYGNMDSPTRNSKSPPGKGRRKSYRGQSRKNSTREPPRVDLEDNREGRGRANTFNRPPEPIQPATVTSQAKDPLKLQGHKSSIKLTLKSQKAPDTAQGKKRTIEASEDVPPAKKPAVTPTKEVKEPVRLTIQKTDKLIKPQKEVAKPRPKAPSPEKTPPPSPVLPPPPVKPAIAPIPEPVPKKKSASSRREELLKQLKAVEDAIARKRTK